MAKKSVSAAARKKPRWMMLGCLGTIVFFVGGLVLAGIMFGTLISVATASSCNTTTGGTNPVVAAQAMFNSGVKDRDRLITMVAIAGAESGFDPAAINPNGGAAGLWQVYPPAHPQYFPPAKPAGWILDPQNNADVSVVIAGGPNIATLTPWETDAAVIAFAAAGGKLAPAGNFTLAETIDDSRADFSAARTAVDTVLAGGGGGGGGTSQDGTPTILGPNSLTADDIAAWWAKQSYGAPRTNPAVTIQVLAGYYLSEGADEGVRGDIAFAQAVLETGGFQSSQSASLNNFAGIGSYDVNPQPGSWPTPQLGVRAQIQLLHKVVSGNGVALAHPDVSPGWGGKQTTSWGGLTANWATDPTYTDKIMAIYNGMLASAGKQIVGDCSVTGNGDTMAIKAAADALDALHLPYCWGGGHNGTPAEINLGAGAATCFRGPGLDCSGAVSYVLQHAGVKVDTMVSGGFMSWGEPANPGDPGVLIWAADGHVFMTVQGQIFSSNTIHSPTGGPGWKGTDLGAAEPVEGPGPNMGYVVRHVPGTT